MNLNDLTPVERTIFVGELFHLISTDEVSFYYASDLIRSGKMFGKLNGVTILPPNNEEQPIPKNIN